MKINIDTKIMQQADKTECAIINDIIDCANGMAAAWKNYRDNAFTENANNYEFLTAFIDRHYDYYVTLDNYSDDIKNWQLTIQY